MSNMYYNIGNTPMLYLAKISKFFGCSVFAKCEFTNIWGSVKDRIALPMILQAEKNGLLKPEGTIIEATSGNTGLALAAVALQRGYKLKLIITDKVSKNKRSILRLHRAELIEIPYTNSTDNPGEFIAFARDIATKTPNSWFSDQFNNQTNFLTHYQQTGPEVWSQLPHEKVTFFSGIGTGGTLSGIGKYLKEQSAKNQVILVDPYGSIHHDLTNNVINPSASNYLIEGIGGDFKPTIARFDIIDDAIKVSDKEAALMCSFLLFQEGIMAGASSGAILAGAYKYVTKRSKCPSLGNLFIIFSDNGKNYSSTFYNADWRQKNLGIEENINYDIIPI